MVGSATTGVAAPAVVTLFVGLLSSVLAAIGVTGQLTLAGIVDSIALLSGLVLVWICIVRCAAKWRRVRGDREGVDMMVESDSPREKRNQSNDPNIQTTQTIQTLALAQH